MTVTQVVELLILGGAHEVHSRSSWSTMLDPNGLTKHAAAAAVIAYDTARRQHAQHLMLIGGLGGVVGLSAWTLFGSGLFRSRGGKRKR